MKNNELIQNFIYGDNEGKGSNLKIEGKKLINYNTCIAYRGNCEIVLNNNNYSQTTKKHQNYILKSGTKITVLDTEKSFREYISNVYGAWV